MKPLLVDIGSFKGEEIKWGLEHGYEIHAFEPNPHMKPFLEIFEDQATINYAAAWNRNGSGNLFLMASPEPGEDGISMIEEKTNVGGEPVLVPTVDIGRYLRVLDKDIDILKINAEGSEYVILESILDNFDLKRVRKLLVEDHEGYISSEKWTKHKELILKRINDLQIKVIPYVQSELS